jgi:hypothetical protein
VVARTRRRITARETKRNGIGVVEGGMWEGEKSVGNVGVALRCERGRRERGDHSHSHGGRRMEREREGKGRGGDEVGSVRDFSYSLGLVTSSCKFCCPYIKLRAGLGNGEEVHGSRILGKWNNMID